jgi:intracellular multiplication protein IcmD
MNDYKKYALPAIQILGAAALCLLPELASAMKIGTVASNVSSNFTALADLISGGAYLGGAGLGIQAALKFKAHNENPQQVKLSQPMVYALVAASLLALPSFIGTASDTLWGDGGASGSKLNSGGGDFAPK